MRITCGTILAAVMAVAGGAEARRNAGTDPVRRKLDAASVKAFQKANPSGGIVPLMTTDSSSHLITISDATMEALSANLPSNCELVNASGVLSCRIKAPGLTIIFK